MLIIAALGETAASTGSEAFFGYMGVACALVFASSNNFLNQILVLPMEQLKVELEFHQWECLNQNWSWDLLFQSSWLVSSESTEWSWQSSCVKRVISIIIQLNQTITHLTMGMVTWQQDSVVDFLLWFTSKISIRQQDLLLELLEMREWELMLSKNRFSLEWFLSSFLLRLLDSTDSLLLWFSHSNDLFQW